MYIGANTIADNPLRPDLVVVSKLEAIHKINGYKDVQQMSSRMVCFLLIIVYESIVSLISHLNPCYKNAIIHSILYFNV